MSTPDPYANHPDTAAIARVPGGWNYVVDAEIGAGTYADPRPLDEILLVIYGKRFLSFQGVRLVLLDPDTNQETVSLRGKGSVPLQAGERVLPVAIRYWEPDLDEPDSDDDQDDPPQRRAPPPARPTGLPTLKVR